MRHLLLILLVMALVGSVFGSSGSVILVSDNAADSAVADTVKEVKGTNVTIIKTRWGEFDENVVAQIRATASQTGGIVIIGGPAAVLADYENLLADYNITRVAGATRKETSAAVLKHFKSEFRGRRLALAYGGDEDGIQEALRRAKAKRGMVLFVDPDDVPEEVEEAINEVNASEVDVVLSPDSNETRIRDKIERRTRARINESVRGNVSERADSMIRRAAQRVEEMDRVLAEVNVTKQALTRLSQETHAKLDDARNAYSEANYGRAFGHAVVANSMAENVLRMAKKLRSFEDKDATAPRVKAKLADRYKNLLNTVLRLEKVMATERVDIPEGTRLLLSEANEHLKLARQAAEDNEFGEAVLHLDKAEHAIASLKVALIRKNLDERKIRRVAVNVTEEELSREEKRHMERKR